MSAALAELPNMLDEALHCASIGWHLFPVHEPAGVGRCSCNPFGECKRGSPAKHPRTANGLSDATVDLVTIGEWWARWPNANIGVRTGEVSGFIVIDEDGEAGSYALKALELKHGKLPPTVVGRTGRADGGRHLFFRHPGFPVGSSTGALGPGVDVRGDGGYVVVAPSLHVSGVRYRWDNPPGATIADAPQWLLKMLRKAAPVAAPRPPLRVVPSPDRQRVLERARRYVAKMDGAVSGSGGHASTFKAAVALVRGFSLSTTDAYEILASEFNPRCSPPWSERELQHKVESAEKDSTTPAGYLLDAEPPRVPPRPPRPPTDDAAGEPVDPVDPPRPSPALFDLPDLAPFPVDALPVWMANMVNAVAAETETPVDMAAMLGLAMLATACARRFEVEPKPGYTEPLNLYTFTVLPSGNRKSSVFRAMSRPIMAVEAELVARESPRIATETAEREVAEQRLAVVKKKLAAEKSAEQITALRLEMESEATGLVTTRVPALPRLLAADVTTEKLSMLLADHGRIAVLEEEGGLFETMSGRYSKGGAPNIDPYLKGHDGGTLRVDRVGRPELHVRRPALTIGMAVQPDILRGLGDKAGFRGRGLTARFLFSIPRSNVGSRQLDTAAADHMTVLEYDRRMRALAGTHAIDDEPARIAFSPEARAEWFAFTMSIEPRRAPRGDLGNMADWASKLDGAVARIAGLLHAADRPHGPHEEAIDAETVTRAVVIGRYLLEHAKAAHGLFGLDPVADKASRVVEWLRARSLREFTKRDLLRANTGGIQSKHELEPVMELLEARGIVWGAVIAPAGGQGGRPRSPVYTVADEVFA